MKQIRVKTASLPALFVSVLSLVACTRDKDSVQPGTLPSFRIAESEKLAIPTAVELPQNPNGNTRVATFYAEGVQKYKAQAVTGSDPVVYQWILSGPKADLYDVSNQKVGTHGAGPYWQLSVADSIFGQAFTPARTATSPDGNAVDWLQLTPKAGTMPKGIFADVSYIQRIATSGGKAPATAPVAAADTIDVQYTAIYRFSKKNP